MYLAQWNVFNVLSRAHTVQRRASAYRSRPEQSTHSCSANNNTCINPLTAYTCLALLYARPPARPTVQSSASMDATNTLTEIPIQLLLAETPMATVLLSRAATVFFLRQRQRQCARLNSYLLFLSRLRGEIFRVSFVLFCVVLWKIHLSKQEARKKQKKKKTAAVAASGINRNNIN